MRKQSPERRDIEARNVIRKINWRPDSEIIEWVRGWMKWPQFNADDLRRIREAL